MDRLDGCSTIGIVSRCFSGALEGGRIGDNQEFSGSGFGPLFGVLFNLILHHSYSWIKGSVETLLFWNNC
jgi:hypothetical protein